MLSDPGLSSDDDEACSLWAVGNLSRLLRQDGHEGFFLTQPSRQSLWKACRQTMLLLIMSPPCIVSRQIQQQWFWWLGRDIVTWCCDVLSFSSDTIIVSIDSSPWEQASWWALSNDDGDDENWRGSMTMMEATNCMQKTKMMGWQPPFFSSP